MNANYVQILPGGLCFAHGPYSEGKQCPQWPSCVTAPKNPDYIAIARRSIEQQDLMRELESAWKKNPDQRLCQFLSNMFGPDPHDLFGIPDDMLREKLKGIVL